MCGFAGELRFGESAAVEAVARMGATKNDRGRVLLRRGEFRSIKKA